MSKSEETLEKVQESKDNEVKEKGKNSVILTPAGIVIQELKCPSLLISHEKKNIIQLGRMCFTGCMIKEWWQVLILFSMQMLNQIYMANSIDSKSITGLPGDHHHVVAVVYRCSHMELGD